MHNIINFTHLTTILQMAGLGIMAYGCIIDIRERRYPKKIFYSSVVIGFLYAFCADFLFQALFGFIFFTIFGIWASDKHVMSNGDLWCLSTLFLYINLLNYKQVIFLIAMLFFWSIVIGLRYNRNVIEDYRKGVTKLKAMFLFKIYFPVDVTGMDIKDTIPFTIILVLALLSTVFVSKVVGF